MKMTKKGIGKRKIEVHKMEGLYPYVRLEDFMKVCKGLEQENKKLSEKIGQLEEINENLDAENRKLKQYYDRDKEELSESCYDLARENENLNTKIKELEQCNLNLQIWLDNKEKVNKSMREELQRFKDLWDSGEF